MTTSEAASALAREGALQRDFLAREPLLERARQMNAEAGLPHDPRLFPTLILTAKDRM